MSNNTTWAGEEATTVTTLTDLRGLYTYNSTFLGTTGYNVTDDLANTTWSLSTEVIDSTVSTTTATPTVTAAIGTVSIETTHLPLTYDFVEVTSEHAQAEVQGDLSTATMTTATMTTVLSVEATTDVERTQSGIPVDIIWVPYVIFSLVLLLLMVVSFVRFHAKNGHKYRRRRAEFWRQLNMQSILDNIPVAGGGTSPPNGGVNIAPSSSGTVQTKRAPDKNKSKPSTSKSRGRKTRRPLVFTSNLNGSMVDVRCGERESLRTFHAKTAPNSHPSSARSLSQKKSSLFASARPNVEPDDDEVFLLQQTRL